MNVTALAVIVDSAVTLGVGYWLNRTAKKSVTKAVKDIGPAIQDALQNSAQHFTDQAKQEIARTIQKILPSIIRAIQRSPSKPEGGEKEFPPEPRTLSDYKEPNFQTRKRI